MRMPDGPHEHMPDPLCARTDDVPREPTEGRLRESTDGRLRERRPDSRRDSLCRRVELWAKRLRVKPRHVRVQHMRRKWGSCSTKGILTLDYQLYDRDQEFQDYVIVHELLHLRVPNHGKLFKSLMTAYVPDWKKHDLTRRL